MRNTHVVVLWRRPLRRGRLGTSQCRQGTPAPGAMSGRGPVGGGMGASALRPRIGNGVGLYSWDSTKRLARQLARRLLRARCVLVLRCCNRVARPHAPAGNGWGKMGGWRAAGGVRITKSGPGGTVRTFCRAAFRGDACAAPALCKRMATGRQSMPVVAARAGRQARPRPPSSLAACMPARPSAGTAKPSLPGALVRPGEGAAKGGRRRGGPRGGAPACPL